MRTFFTRSFLLTAFVCSSYFVNAQSYIIPVVVHVLHQGGPENISDAQILDAMRILNKDFNKQNADTSQVIPSFQNLIANVGIEFHLVCIDRIFTPLTNSTDFDSARINQWNPARYLNIWSVKSSQPPGEAATSISPATADSFPAKDGIGILHNYFGSIGTSSPANSRALTHYAGHYLNLKHPWGGTDPGIACGDDDVNDTPVTRGWTACPSPANADVCSPLIIENYQNFMEYSYCSHMFTVGQKDRMIACLNSSVAQRNSLWVAPDTTSGCVISGINTTVLNTSISIFPNPCTTAFTIQLTTTPVAETYFQLYDALGRQVKREEINSTTTTIHRNSLPSGIYFWQLSERNKILERGKVVME